jgi:hypothetical protein
MPHRNQTTKDISLLKQLSDGDQLILAPEFQRNSVWPKQAKAYLIDTILNDRPIPVIFLQRGTSSQSGRHVYRVIDGQQRLRAIFEFMEDRFKLSESKGANRDKKFSSLSETSKEKIFNYSLIVEELYGYSEKDIRDIFVRMNKYGLKLSQQERRHAQYTGVFSKFVEGLSRMPFWKAEHVFTEGQIKRFRVEEFMAELSILVLEGPQDKKSAVDLYYDRYDKKFPYKSEVTKSIEGHLRFLESALPDLGKTRFRKQTDLYGIIAALEDLSRSGKTLSKLNSGQAGKRLRDLAADINSKDPSKIAARYALAASRQTDNIIPRLTRMEILKATIHPE